MNLYCIYQVEEEYNHWNGDRDTYDVIATEHQYFTLWVDAQAICDEHNEQLKVDHRKAHDDREAAKVAEQEKKIKRNQLLAAEGLERLRTDFEYQPYKPGKYYDPANWHPGWESVVGYWKVKEVEVHVR